MISKLGPLQSLVFKGVGPGGADIYSVRFEKGASFLMGQGPESVLKVATLETFQLQLIVPADLELTHGYGIGFEVERRENYTEFGHGGAVAGYTASLLMNRKTGVGVIVPSNRAANPTSIAQRALDILSK